MGEGSLMRSRVVRWEGCRRGTVLVPVQGGGGGESARTAAAATATHVAQPIRQQRARAAQQSMRESKGKRERWVVWRWRVEGVVCELNNS